MLPIMQWRKVACLRETWICNRSPAKATDDDKGQTLTAERSVNMLRFISYSEAFVEENNEAVRGSFYDSINDTR